MKMHSSYLRLGLTLSAVGFVPHGWSHRWFTKTQWSRVRHYELVSPFEPRPDWKQLRIVDPYPSDGYYLPGQHLMDAMVDQCLWDVHTTPHLPPGPPRPERVLHDFRLLAVLDALSDSELLTWWTEVQLYRHLARTATTFRVPDGMYRSDTGHWVAVEVWSRAISDPVLQQKARSTQRYTHAERFRIANVGDGRETVWDLAREAV